MRVEQFGNELQITRRWFTSTYLGLLLFAIFWDGFLIVWYTFAFLQLPNDPGIWVMILFPVLHVAVGVALTYVVLAGLLNRTYIVVSNGVLSVRNGPVPWRGLQGIATADIEQLYLTEGWNSSHSRPSFRLNALLKSGRKVTVLPAVLDPDEGWFVEQQTEAFLGIEDVPVAGEV